MFKPSILVEVYELARLQDLADNGQQRRYNYRTEGTKSNTYEVKPVERFKSNSSSEFKGIDRYKAPVSSATQASQLGNVHKSESVITNVRKIPNYPSVVTPQLMTERRSKGLCVYCGDKYSPSHDCPRKKKYQLTLIGESNSDEERGMSEEPLKSDDNGNDSDDTTDLYVAISLHALKGGLELTPYNTMTMIGIHGSIQFQIMIDNGSTHNFMDYRVAELLRCELVPIKELGIEVAGGQVLYYSQKVEGVPCSINNFQFTISAYVMELGGYDLVLGIQWMSTLGTIHWNFKEMTMDLIYQGQPVKLKGAYGLLKEPVDCKKLNQMMKKPIEYQVYQLNLCNNQS